MGKKKQTMRSFCSFILFQLFCLFLFMTSKYKLNIKQSKKKKKKKKKEKKKERENDYKSMTIITEYRTVKTQIMGFEKWCPVGAVQERLLHKYVMKTKEEPNIWPHLHKLNPIWALWIYGKHYHHAWMALDEHPMANLVFLLCFNNTKSIKIPNVFSHQDG